VYFNEDLYEFLNPKIVVAENYGGSTSYTNERYKEGANEQP
jgi:hypothetical protein